MNVCSPYIPLYTPIIKTILPLSWKYNAPTDTIQVILGVVFIAKITWQILTNKTVPEKRKLNTIQKMQTTQNTTKQNYPASVACYETWPGNKKGLFDNTPETTWGTTSVNHSEHVCKCLQNLCTRHTLQFTCHKTHAMQPNIQSTN